MNQVEIWHDTTMWNEGFEQAQEPYVVLGADQAATKVIEKWLDQWNAVAEMDHLFRMRAQPHPMPSTPIPDAAQALGFVQGAIFMWQGL